MELMNSDIYTPCKDYPDNFIDSLFDMSNLSLEQTEDGSIIAKGPVFLKKSVDPAVPVTVILKYVHRMY